MINVRVSVKNQNQLKKWQRLAPIAFRDGLRRAVNRTALAIGREAAKQVTSGPNQALDTGRLRASIIGGSYKGGSFTRAASGFQPAKPTNLTAEVGPNVDYAVYIHEGTRFMRARPFLVAAVEKEQPNVDEFFTAEIRSALLKVGKLT